MVRFHHVSLSVNNLQRSLDFYKKLGFRQTKEWKQDDGSLTIVHITLEDLTLELFCYKEHQKNSKNKTLEQDLRLNGIKHFALQVKSVQKMYEFCVEQNFEIAEPITNGRVVDKYFFVKDPDGIFVEFVEDTQNS